MPKARPYQQQCVDAIKNAWNKGYHTGLVHLPTGTGKTFVSWSVLDQLIDLRKDRMIFVGGVNRDLVFQAKQAFLKYNPDLKQPTKVSKLNTERQTLGIVMGNLNEVKARTIFASLQTLVDKSDSLLENAPEARPITQRDVEWVIIDGVKGVKLSKKSNREFLVSPRVDAILKHGLITHWIHDEAHHMVADGSFTIIRRIQQLYELLNTDSLKIIGNTATPQRTDGIGLSNILDRVYFSRDLSWAQRNGYIVDFAQPIAVSIQKEAEVNQDTSSDAPEDKLSVFEDWSSVIVKAWKENARNRPTVAYTGTLNGLGPIEAGKMLRQEFQEQGYAAAHVSSEDTIDQTGQSIGVEERGRVFQDFCTGKINVIVNFNVIVEGVDLPPASCVLLARPVNELTLTQIAGRVIRRFGGDDRNEMPAKEDALIIDFTGKQLVLSTLGLLTGFEYDPMENALSSQISFQDIYNQLEEINRLHSNRMKELIQTQDFMDAEVLASIVAKILRKLEETVTQKELRKAQKLIKLFYDEDTLNILGSTKEGTEGSYKHKGVTYTYTQIQRKSSGDWFADDKGCWSITLGNDWSLLITTPNYTRSNYVKLILDDMFENDWGDPVAKENLEKIFIMTDQFMLWEVTGKPYSPSIQNISQYEALHEAEIYAIDYATSKGATKAFMNKKQAWKSKTKNGVSVLPTDKQLTFLKRLEAANPYKFMYDKENLSKGEAAKVITHLIATKPLANLLNNPIPQKLEGILREQARGRVQVLNILDKLRNS